MLSLVVAGLVLGAAPELPELPEPTVLTTFDRGTVHFKFMLTETPEGDRVEVCMRYRPTGSHVWRSTCRWPTPLAVFIQETFVQLSTVGVSVGVDRLGENFLVQADREREALVELWRIARRKNTPRPAKIAELKRVLHDRFRGAG